MTPAEEDTLVERVRHIGITEGGDPVRIAIRAAVAAERERCARIALDPDYSPEGIAAAIRRGEK